MHFTSRSEESTPEVEVKAVVGTTDKSYWAPIEDDKVIAELNDLTGNLMTVAKDHYRNKGASNYVSFTMGKRRTVVCIWLSKKSARVAVGTVINGNSRYESYILKAEGIFKGSEKVTIKEITKQIRAYIKQRGW